MLVPVAGDQERDRSNGHWRARRKSGKTRTQYAR